MACPATATVRSFGGRSAGRNSEIPRTSLLSREAFPAERTFRKMALIFARQGGGPCPEVEALAAANARFIWSMTCASREEYGEK
jgi:hypothetical protein